MGAFVYWLVIIYPAITLAAHAGFNVHYPWSTRTVVEPERAGLRQYQPFCGKFALHTVMITQT